MEEGEDPLMYLARFDESVEMLTWGEERPGGTASRSVWKPVVKLRDRSAVIITLTLFVTIRH